MFIFSKSSDLQVNVRDFGPSWRDGFAFASIIHTINPDLINVEKLKEGTNQENLETIFSVAENKLGITRLLEPKGNLNLVLWKWHLKFKKI